MKHLVEIRNNHTNAIIDRYEVDTIDEAYNLVEAFIDDDLEGEQYEIFDYLIDGRVVTD